MYGVDKMGRIDYKKTKDLIVNESVDEALDFFLKEVTNDIIETINNFIRGKNERVKDWESRKDELIKVKENIESQLKFQLINRKI